MDPLSANRNPRANWHDRQKQTELLKGLRWMWLVWDTHFKPDGSPKEFIRDIYGTPNGSDIASVALAWFGAAIKRVKQQALRENFMMPPGFSGTAAPPRAGVPQAELFSISGLPLTLAIDFGWELGEQTFGASDPLSLEARARWIQCFGIWKLFERLGPRVHQVHAINFVTKEQWDSLDSSHWDHQMRYGIFIVVGYRGKTEMQDVTIHILDTKKGAGAGNKRKRDAKKTSGAKDVSVTIEVAAHGNWLNCATDKQLFTRMYEKSFLVLHPETRHYTANISGDDCWREVPVYVWSLPTMQIYNPKYLVFNQSGPRTDTYKEALENEFKRQRINSGWQPTKKQAYELDPNIKPSSFAKLSKEGMVEDATKYPPLASMYDDTLSTSEHPSGTQKQMEAAMDDMLRQLGGRLSMRPNLSHCKEKKKKYHWQLKNYSALLKKRPTYEMADIQLSDFVGLPRLSGGTFTVANMKTLEILGAGIRNKTLRSEVKFAGRHVNQSYVMSAKQFMEDMDVHASKRNSDQPETVKIHLLADNELERLRQIESHASGEIAENHYHTRPKEFPLCRVSRGTLPHLGKRLEGCERAGLRVVYSFKEGLEDFPEDLVETTGDTSLDIGDRWYDPRKLTTAEQIQNLDYLNRFKAVLKIRCEEDAILKSDPLVAKIDQEIKLALGFDPNVDDRRQVVGSSGVSSGVSSSSGSSSMISNYSTAVSSASTASTVTPGSTPASSPAKRKQSESQSSNVGGARL
jgi:hypothetical protein